MLTNELLTTVEGLTPEQIEAIANLSKADENTVIAAKVGEIHRQYDADIEAVTGVKKEGNVKTYTHLKNVLGDFKSKAESVETLQGKVTELQDKIKSGAGNEAIKQELQDKTALVAQLQTEIENVKSDFTEQLEAEKQKAFSMKIDSEFSNALTGLKFKDESIIPVPVRDTFVNSAKSKLLTEYTPDYIDNGQGGQKLVFRTKDGQIANNPDNKYNPFTASELLKKEVSTILDTGKKQQGAGTSPNGNGGNGSILDLSGATTRVQADEVIKKHIASLGISKLDPKFAEMQMELRTENNVADLPRA